MASTQRGFTIIEVILFLAISGLLLAIAIASINANINNSRFNDAIRSTTSYLQRQYNEVASGQSDRSESVVCDPTNGQITTGASSSAGMTNCVILGRYIWLKGSELTVRYITGHRSTLTGISADDTTSIIQMNPRVAGTDVYDSTYSVPWNIAIAKTTLPTNIPSGSFPSTGLAIIRSPASGNIVFYTKGGVTSAEETLDNLFIRDQNRNKEAEICFADGSSARVGRIAIATGRGQEIIKTDLANTAVCP